MYTVVLMMAMTGSGEATTFGGRRCNGGCNGGCSVASSCHGGCNGGCHGGGHARRARCHGGCNGGGCHGGCHASSGCHGGCHGGCHASSNGYVTVQPRRVNGAEESEIAPIPNGQALNNGMAPATIIIELPAEARLTVDGQATTSTSGRRVFMSPPLAQGEYFYTVNAEIMRNGQPVTVTRRVPVTAGRETRITLNFDRDTNSNAQPRQQVRPAAGETAPQPRDLPNLERPKNNNNRNPQPNP